MPPFSQNNYQLLCNSNPLYCVMSSNYTLVCVKICLFFFRLRTPCRDILSHLGSFVLRADASCKQHQNRGNVLVCVHTVHNGNCVKVFPFIITSIRRKYFETSYQLPLYKHKPYWHIRRYQKGGQWLHRTSNRQRIGHKVCWKMGIDSNTRWGTYIVWLLKLRLQ